MDGEGDGADDDDDDDDDLDDARCDDDDGGDDFPLGEGISPAESPRPQITQSWHGEVVTINNNTGRISVW